MSLLDLVPDSTINGTSLKQIVVEGAMPAWRDSDLEVLAELKPVLRDRKRHFVRTEPVRKRLEEEDRALTEQYVASWREALKLDPLGKLTADQVSERFEKLRRDLEQGQSVPGQVANARIGGSVAALVVQSLDTKALRLRDGEARLWTVDLAKFKEMENLKTLAEELDRRYPVIPPGNSKTDKSYSAHLGTTLDLKAWARCTSLTVLARRSGAVLLLDANGFDGDGRLATGARMTHVASAEQQPRTWPTLSSGALTMTSNLREWVDFTTPRPSLWYHDGLTAPRSSLDQAMAELLLAHWAKDGVQTVAGWVPTSTLTTLVKNRQGANTISAAIWNDLKKTLVVTHDKERKLVLVRPRNLLAAERERIEPAAWTTFAAGNFTFARWGTALAQSPVGVEWSAITQPVNRALQAIEPRTSTWTGITFAAAKSAAWLRIFAWTNPLPYDRTKPVTRQSIWYIATNDVSTPLAYAGEMGKVEAFKDTKSRLRIMSFSVAEEWKARARQGPIESDFEVGSIETHEARYRVQAIPNETFGESVHDIGVGSGVIKRMRFEPQ